MTRRVILRLTLVILAFTAVQCVVLIGFFDFTPVAASEEAGPIDTLLDVMIALSALIFAIVLVVGVWLAWTYRAKPGDESDGEPIHGNTRLEIAWTLIPTVIVLGCAIYSWVVLADIEAKEPDRMKVEVTAQQFAWAFEYPEEEVTSNELVVPRGQQIEFDIAAVDVLHSFWVPEWRIKQDAVPGQRTQAVVTPSRTGTYPLVCAELCGLGHATMRATVKVMEPAEFRRWIADKKQGEGSQVGGLGVAGTPEQIDDSIVQSGGDRQPEGRGAQVYAAQGCGSCHTLAAANSTGTVGPELDRALRGRDREFIRTAIVEPDAELAEGFQRGIMPTNYDERIGDGDLEALVDFLFESTRGGR